MLRIILTLVIANIASSIQIVSMSKTFIKSKLVQSQIIQGTNLSDITSTTDLTKSRLVFRTEIKSEADKIVYITPYKTEASVIVYETKLRAEVNQSKGIWYWTKYKQEASWKVYLTKHKTEANLIIYYTKYKHEAISQ